MLEIRRLVRNKFLRQWSKLSRYFPETGMNAGFISWKWNSILNQYEAAVVRFI